MTQSPGTQRPAAPMIMGLALYVIVTGFVYWDALRYLHEHGGAMGRMTWVAWYGTRGDGQVVLFPWSSVPMAAGTVAGMLWSIRALRRNAPIARLGTFFLSFGVVLPQAVLLFMYLSGPRDFPRSLSLAVALPLVATPVLAFSTPSVARRFEAYEHTLAWAKLPFGRARLIATGVLTGWFSLLGVLYVGYSDYIGTPVGVIAALASIALVVATLGGILALRTWSVLTALVVPLLLWTVLAQWQARAVACGYLDEGWGGTWATCLLGIPTLLIVLLEWPFLRSFTMRVFSTER